MDTGQAGGPIRAKIAGRLDQWEEGTNLKGSVLALTDLDPRLELAETTGTGLHWTKETFWWILCRRSRIACVLNFLFLLLKFLHLAKL